MAEIHVSNWEEFANAVSTEDADVVLPENALWDMNELLPGGTEYVDFRCASIKGNGTTIANLRVSGQLRFYSAVQITSLGMTNILHAPPSNLATIQLEVGGQKFVQCTFSALVGGLVTRFIGGTKTAEFELCAFNVEGQSASFTFQNITSNALGSKFNMCRIKVTAINLTDGSYPNYVGFFSGADNCELVLNLPLCTTMSFNGMRYCMVRGDLQNIKSTYGFLGVSDPIETIVNAGDAPNMPAKTGITLVTDDQMRNAEYLRNHGFLIGV